MITGKIGQAGQYIHTRVVRGLVATHLNPNILTFIGFSINVYAACLFAEGRFLHAALTVILAGVFDMSDGPVARITNQATPFGAFFDSMMDRYSDVVLFIGILVYYARAGLVLYVVLAAVVMAGSLMTSYTRARAESLVSSCQVGFLERAERIVLIIIGGLFNHMGAVLWVIAFFSNLTVLHRCLYTRQQIRGLTFTTPK